MRKDGIDAGSLERLAENRDAWRSGLAALQLRGSVQTVIELRKSDVEGDINKGANSRDSVSCATFVGACTAHGLVSTPISGHISKKQRGWTALSNFTIVGIESVVIVWIESVAIVVIKTVLKT